MKKKKRSVFYHFPVQYELVYEQERLTNFNCRGLAEGDVESVRCVKWLTVENAHHVKIWSSLEDLAAANKPVFKEGSVV